MQMLVDCVGAVRIVIVIVGCFVMVATVDVTTVYFVLLFVGVGYKSFSQLPKVYQTQMSEEVIQL